MTSSVAKTVLNEVDPCDDCNNREKCKSQQLACKAFVEYAATGRFNAFHRFQPTSQRYQKLFSDNEA